MDNRTEPGVSEKDDSDSEALLLGQKPKRRGMPAVPPLDGDPQDQPSPQEFASHGMGAAAKE